jgi:hypothetical protein
MNIDYPLPNQIYKHYKGGTYQVITLSTHTETGEILVIYKSLNFGSNYARPIQPWLELTDDGKKRFELIS